MESSQRELLGRAPAVAAAHGPNYKKVASTAGGRRQTWVSEIFKGGNSHYMTNSDDDDDDDDDDRRCGEAAGGTVSRVPGLD